MKMPNFWWRKPPSVFAWLLLPISLCIGYCAQKRFLRQGEKIADLPVLCVGNFVVGGAGKTPFVLYLTEMLKRMKKTPVVLTRGYRGLLPGPVVVLPEHHTAVQVGDEALYLSRFGTTIVARDRVAGAKLAKKHGADVLVMDDGFQNPSLEKDISLLMIDSERGIGNGYVYPSGPLRAPIRTQLKKTSLIVMIGTGSRAAGISASAKKYHIPLVTAEVNSEEKMSWSGKRVLAFAGIAFPEKFYQTLKEVGADLVDTQNFPDHHFFTPAQARDLYERAEKQDLLLATTEKDLIRLTSSRHPDLQKVGKAAHVLKVSLSLRDQASCDLLKKTLSACLFPEADSPKSLSQEKPAKSVSMVVRDKDSKDKDA